MPYLNEANKPLDDAYLRKLGVEQARDRDKEEKIRVEVAKGMGILDQNGDPIREDEFESDPGWTPEQPPPSRNEGLDEYPEAVTGDVVHPKGCFCADCKTMSSSTVTTPEHPMDRPPTLSETLEVIRILLGEWKAQNLSDAAALETVKDVLANPAKYRLEG